jgi:SecD/SecF fusion protein
MQGKQLVKFFAGFLLMVCLYQFLLILPTRSVESKAEAYGQKRAAGIQNGEEKALKVNEFTNAYLDSASSKSALNLGVVRYSYEDLKRQQLALGLDLRGGMSAVLQVNLREFIVSLANNSADPAFLSALDKVKAMQENSQKDYITLFAEAYNETSGGKSLAPLFMTNPAMSSKIALNSDNNAVLSVIRKEAGETVGRTYEMLKQRIDRLGVLQPNVFLDENTDRITVELPGIKNAERAKNVLQSSAKLEFWEMYTADEIYPVLERLNIALKNKGSLNDTTNVKRDSLGNIIPNTTASKDTASGFAQSGPLFKVLSASNQGFSVVGMVSMSDTSALMTMLRGKEAQTLVPQNCRLLLSRKPSKEKGEYTNKYELYAIKMRQIGVPPLDGTHITDAGGSTNTITGGNVINLQMDDEGSRAWANMTGANVGKPVAIVLDDRVVSAPRVNEKISGGRTEISGDFSLQEATDNANILKIGKLPASLEIIDLAQVGPSLGKATVNAGLLCLLAGLLTVLGFMWWYYGSAGLMSIVALVFNLLFIIGTLSSLGTVLTFPGIAGIVLTMGMAVDANVLIFERAREALREGLSMAAAIKEGFSGSMSAIIDSNVTTLFTALILAIYGLGPLKGFGVVLAVGVVSSVFSAVLVCRLFIEGWLDSGKTLNVGSKANMDRFFGMNIDFVGKLNIGIIISSIVILAGVASMFTRGFELGVDLRGGRTYTVLLDKAVDVDKMSEAITSVLVDANGKTYAPIVKEFDRSNQVKITTAYLQNSQEPNVDEIVLTKIRQGVEKYSGQTISPEEFNSKYLLAQNKVGATIADDLRGSAAWTAFLALAAIFVYVLIRFNRWQFSLGAVIALIHDVLIVLSVFSIFHGLLPFPMEIDQTFIAAILTVIGYSVNDTVIVFDRFRENLNNYKSGTMKELINESINVTFSRTIITSATTLFTIIVLLIFGGSTIQSFALALTVGIIAGTYSSIFIAAPIVLKFSSDEKLRSSVTPKHQITEEPTV